MSIFGSDYPPGCHGTPFDEDVPCEICGGWDIDPLKATPNRPACICKECPECGQKGDLNCYKPRGQGGHGLRMRKAQVTQLATQQALWEADSAAEAAYLESDEYKQGQKELESFYADMAVHQWT